MLANKHSTLVFLHESQKERDDGPDTKPTEVDGSLSFIDLTVQVILELVK